MTTCLLSFFLSFFIKSIRFFQKPFTCSIDAVEQYIGSYAIGERTRAFLKVQDGCDYKCTY